MALASIGDAVAHVRQLLHEQVQAARQGSAPPNVAFRGDQLAKALFYTLLPTDLQRTVFGEIVAVRDSWPRLRSLFGAPPYGFLLPEDAGMLRAAGIAATRANMSHPLQQMSITYSQFGSGHYTDLAGRQYRVRTPPNTALTNPLPWNMVEGTSVVVLDVRVPRKLRSEKRRILSEGSQAGLDEISFPRVGESLRLRQTDDVLRVEGKRGNASVVGVTVRRVLPRAAGSSTACVVVHNTT